MNRVLFLYERDMPTVSITRECMKILNTSGIIENKFCKVQNITLDEFNDSDVLFFIRPNDSLSVDIAKKAKDSGRLIVTMFDDDLLNLPDSIPFAPWRKRSMMQLLEMTDVMVSSSQYLLNIYGKKYKIKRTAKIDTIVHEDEFSKIAEKEHKEVRIVYAAGPKHIEVFNRYIMPILPRL